MVLRLVAVGVFADEAGAVAVAPPRGPSFVLQEQPIQGLRAASASAVELDKAFRVVHLVPRVVERAGLGVVEVAVASADGLSIRVVFEYDATTKTDLVSFDIIYGITALDKSLLVDFS